MLRVGFFRAFKGRGSVLLGGAPNDILFLLTRLRQFVSNEETSLPIHNIAEVASNHPAHLYAIDGRKQFPLAKTEDFENGFIWNCTTDWEATQGMLETLIGPASATPRRAMPGSHQFFDLDMPESQLVVAVDEYDEHWWAKFG